MTTKEHPEIPSGVYCYTYKNGKRIICPHWEHKLINGFPGARCKFLETEAQEHDENLIWDQVKECNINREWDD